MMTTRTETDASQWEYETYAPAGETCPTCTKPIKALERVRRGQQQRQSGGLVVVYWHVDKCPR